MAKTQNLSLNPTKISGTCGRLMCCLKYEQEAYEDLVKHSPKQESFVETPDGAGTVSSVNLLRQTVQVRLEDAPETPKCYHNCEICVVRNGKGKRPEGYVQPPLEELAKLRKPVEKEEVPDLKGSASPLAAALEAVFNGETPQYEGFDAPQQSAKSSRSRSRSRRSKSGAPKQQPAAQEGQQPQKERPPRKPQSDRPRSEERKNQERRPRPEKAAPAPAQNEGSAPAEGGEKRRRPRRRRPKSSGPAQGNQE